METKKREYSCWDSVRRAPVATPISTHTHTHGPHVQSRYRTRKKTQATITVFVYRARHAGRRGASSHTHTHLRRTDAYCAGSERALCTKCVCVYLCVCYADTCLEKREESTNRDCCMRMRGTLNVEELTRVICPMDALCVCIHLFVYLSISVRVSCSCIDMPCRVRTRISHS